MKRLKYLLAAVLILYLGLIVYAYLPTETVPVETLAGKDSRFIEVDGKQIHYLRKGTGAPLVLVHGFGGSTYTWRDLMPLLTDKYTVYALDLPGFGLSDKSPDADYDLQSQADCVLGFMDAVGLSSAALVGHSMGGVIISFASVRAPAKADRLVIVDAGFYHGGAPAFLQYLFFPLSRIVAKTYYTKNGRSRPLLASYHNKSIVTDAVIDAYLTAGKTPNAIAAMEKMTRNPGPRQYLGLSSKISVPALLVWGRHDTGAPLQDAERLHSEIKGSHLKILDDSGHYVQEEKPAELAEAIRAFLK